MTEVAPLLGARLPFPEKSKPCQSQNELVKGVMLPRKLSPPRLRMTKSMGTAKHIGCAFGWSCLPGLDQASQTINIDKNDQRVRFEKIREKLSANHETDQNAALNVVGVKVAESQ